MEIPRRSFLVGLGISAALGVGADFSYGGYLYSTTHKNLDKGRRVGDILIGSDLDPSQNVSVEILESTHEREHWISSVQLCQNNQRVAADLITFSSDAQFEVVDLANYSNDRRNYSVYNAESIVFPIGHIAAACDVEALDNYGRNLYSRRELLNHFLPSHLKLPTTKPTCEIDAVMPARSAQRDYSLEKRPNYVANFTSGLFIDSTGKLKIFLGNQEMEQCIANGYQFASFFVGCSKRQFDQFFNYEWLNSIALNHLITMIPGHEYVATLNNLTQPKPIGRSIAPWTIYYETASSSGLLAPHQPLALGALIQAVDYLSQGGEWKVSVPDGGKGSAVMHNGMLMGPETSMYYYTPYTLRGT